MSFWEKVKLKMSQLMAGRCGVDELGLAMLIAGLVLSMVDRFLGTGLLSLLGLVLYGGMIYRMFSRDLSKRMAENDKYNAYFDKASKKTRQWWIRQKNRKEYKYFRCPGCKSLMRLKRGSGTKHIVCPKCHREFDEQA